MTCHVARRRDALPARRIVALVHAAIVLAACIASALMAPEPASADRLSTLRQQADILQAQVDRLDEDLSHARERLRSTRYRLEELDGQAREAAHELRVARESLDAAHRALVQHALEVYRSGGQEASVWWAVTNASSISELDMRMQAAHRIGVQDAEVTRRLTEARSRVSARHERLARLRARQQVLVAAASREQRKVAGLLGRKQSALGRANTRVRRLVEQRRQAAAAAAAAAARAQAQDIASARSRSATPAASTFLPPASMGGDGSSVALRAVAAAETQLGTPYVWGGSSPGGFDCSGLVMWAYAQAGVSLPRTTYAQWGSGRHVSVADLQPGDLVFAWGLGHVTMYVGNGTVIHAPHSGDVVRFAPMSYMSIDGVVRVA